ncbi:MAG: hypothetical protein HZC18_06950 [Candidatus Omnitrophica bacterium]|nr:hypothetical protein [Candidatus Omnitrophota bacterium]
MTLLISRIILTLVIVYVTYLIWTSNVDLVLWSKNAIRGWLPINKEFPESVKTEQSPEMIKTLRDNAMWSVEGFQQGDRRSYLTLLSWASNPKDTVTKNLIISAIEEIKDVYGQTDVMRQHIEPVRNPHRWWICKESIPSCHDGFEEPTGYKAQNIINHLARKLWQERGRAASILRNIKTASDKDRINEDATIKEQLFDKLIERLNLEKENSLFVAKMAFETYKDLTGFSSDGVFDFAGAIKDWETRKEKILRMNF